MVQFIEKMKTNFLKYNSDDSHKEKISELISSHPEILEKVIGKKLN